MNSADCRMERFFQDCKESGIIIPPNFHVRLGESSGVRHMFTPTGDGIYAAIARAARQLRRSPTDPLLDHGASIPEQVRRRHQDDIPTQTLINLLNPAQTQVESPREPLQITSNIAKGIGACTRVEHYFGLAFLQMQYPGERVTSAVPSFGYEFIVDRDRVVGIGKGYGEPSVLSLESLSVNGHEYPAGTLMRADTETNRGRSITNDEDVVARGVSYARITNVPVADLADVVPMRLTAFALDDPAERAADFREPLQETSSLTEALVRDASLHDLRAIAQTAFNAL